MLNESSGNPPAVSVIIPAYKAADDIGVALASVFAQTFADYEVVVVNDGSPDTNQLERALEPFALRVRYIVQANGGAAAARNTGILASVGQYVALLDADDRWEPDFLASQIRHLERNPACALVYADARITGDTALAGRTFMEATPSRGEVTVETLLRQDCTVLTSTVVARRECLLASGLFNPTLRRGHDFDLWVRIALGGNRIEYQRRILAERRVRMSGLSGSQISELDRACAVFRHLLETLDFSPSQRTALCERLAWISDRREIECARMSLTEGNFTAARRSLSRIVNPTRKVQLLQAALSVAPRFTRAAAIASRRLPAAQLRRARTRLPA